MHSSEAQVPSTRKLGLRKPQESLRVQMTDLLFLHRADGSLIQKGSPLLIRTEGIIDREEDAVGSHHCMASNSGGSVKKPLVVIEK